MDAQARRRERRAEKQAQWKAANPLLVGVSAKPVNCPILSLNRKPKCKDWICNFRKQPTAAK